MRWIASSTRWHACVIGSRTKFADKMNKCPYFVLMTFSHVAILTVGMHISTEIHSEITKGVFERVDEGFGRLVVD